MHRAAIESCVIDEMERRGVIKSSLHLAYSLVDRTDERERYIKRPIHDCDIP